MVSGLPSFLVSEVRLAFYQCARQPKWTGHQSLHPNRVKYFSVYRGNLASRDRKSSLQDVKQTKPQHDLDARGIVESATGTSSKGVAQPQESRELVPRSRDGRAIGTGRTTDAPMRIIPKSDITPRLRLTPKERLHIEMLTRRPPPVIKEVKPYKERLLIYHHGNAAENALIFLKVFALVCAGVVSAVIVPAHYYAGTPLWMCGILLIGGFLPSAVFHRLLKPLVTRVHLRLPPNARVSPEAAMKYAKNLPVSAQMDMSFTRITALAGTVTVNVADLQAIPQASRWPWQSANLRWIGNYVNKGNRLRPNPTEFSVKPTAAVGKAKRDVIPGIWPEIYNRLIGTPKPQVSRWKQA